MNLSDLTKMGPDWLRACPECQWGIIEAPPVPKNIIPLYEHRRMQAQAGRILFCLCEAGERYRRYLLGMEPPKPGEWTTEEQCAYATAANEPHKRTELATSE